MKSLLLFALILTGSPVFATGTLKECQEKAEEKPKDCSKEAAGVKAQSDAAATSARNNCEATKSKSGDLSVPDCSGLFQRANEASKSVFDEGVARCEDMAKECDNKCTPGSSAKPQEKTQMANLKKQCRQKIETTKNDLKKGKAGNQTGSDGGEKTGQEAKGNGTPAAAPPAAPQQSNNDDEKPDATQPQSTPQQAAAPQEQKKEEDKNGKSGFGDDAKTQSADNACSGGKFMCPGCPGFLQKCPNGDANACISKMSSSDQNIINSNCGGATGGSTAQAITNPTTQQSLLGMGMGGASGGSTTGAVSGGMDTQSMLNDGKKNDVEPHEGHKEGGSLGTESAGGGGGGGNDSFGSSGESPFGDTQNSLNLSKAVPRSLASAFQSSVDSNHSVVDRYGPNLFKILGDTIEARCGRNQLLHCPNRK